MENKYRKMIQLWADEPYITHEDFTRCGQCYKQKLTSDVSKEFLEQDRASTIDDVKALTAEVDKRWEQTDLYKKMKELLDKGMGFDAAVKEMAKNNYIP
jgi:uncharacterized protein YfbU (UPF0304 family)